MAFIPVLDCTEVVLKASLTQTVQAINVFHVENSAGTPTSMNDILDEFDNWINTGGGANENLVDLTSDQTVYDELIATDISSVAGVQIAKQLNDLGVRTSARLPANVALVGTWKTATRGRSYRGRTYFHSFCEDQNEQTGVPSAALQANLILTMADLHSRLVTAGYPLCVASKYEKNPSGPGSIPRTIGITTPITEFSVDDVWDSQRRRLR